LVEGGSIDIAVSPQAVTLSALLAHIREGAPAQVYSLRRGAAEAIEAVVRGDRRTSRVIGRSLEELDLPEATPSAASSRRQAADCPPRHRDRAGRPRDPVRDGQAADARRSTRCSRSVPE
jgi:hypothetical protein